MPIREGERCKTVFNLVSEYARAVEGQLSLAERLDEALDNRVRGSANANGKGPPREIIVFPCH
jgi:hypothetical protein